MESKEIKVIADAIIRGVLEAEYAGKNEAQKDVVTGKDKYNYALKRILAQLKVSPLWRFIPFFLPGKRYVFLIMYATKIVVEVFNLLYGKDWMEKIAPSEKPKE